MVTFAAFHVEFPRIVRNRIEKRLPLTRVRHPHRLTATMLESARQAHPGCRTVVLSDRHTRFSSRIPPFRKPFPTDVEIVRYDLDLTLPLVARTTAWIEFLRKADDHVVFVDSDILFNSGVEAVFDWDCDVALTYRAHDQWPINAGIGFAHRDHLETALAFYERWLELSHGVYSDTADWGGEQDAVRELVKGADFTRTDVQLHTENGFRVLLLPGADYNFSSPHGTPMDGFYPDKKVLHFKSHRKPDMVPYWKRHIRRSSTGA